MATKKLSRPFPRSPAAWLEEIALAYDDAREAIPFTRLVGGTMESTDLFHLAPVVAIKFRGLSGTASRLRQATEAALSSYVASTEATPELKAHGPLAFAFCYLASHFAVDLVSEAQVDSIMEYLVTNESLLRERIAGPRPRSRSRSKQR